MTDIIQALYDYCNENRTPNYLLGPEYSCICQRIEEKETAIRELLPTEGQKLLVELSSAMSSSNAIEMEAAFQAGLSAGLELLRL